MMKTLKPLLLKLAFYALAIAAATVAHAQATRPPIIQAAGNGQMATVVALLDQGVSPDTRDSNGITPLMAAAAKGHFEIVQTLMIRGAHKELTDAKGRTAFDYAFEKNAIDVIGLLRDGS
jgi:ankyrin repeat protein